MPSVLFRHQRRTGFATPSGLILSCFFVDANGTKDNSTVMKTDCFSKKIEKSAPPTGASHGWHQQTSSLISGVVKPVLR
jgi:hypothetical protein